MFLLENLRLKRCALYLKCKLLNMQWLLFSVQNNFTLLGMTYKEFLLLENHFTLRQKVGLLCTSIHKSIVLNHKSHLQFFDTSWIFLNERCYFNKMSGVYFSINLTDSMYFMRYVI